MRRRGEFPRGESIRIHQLVVLHDARRVSSSLYGSQLPVLNFTLGQMGDPIVPVFLMGIHADQIHMDSARRTWLSLVPVSTSCQLTATALITLCSQGILICVGGLGMLVGSDELTDKDYTAVDKVKGDMFMLAGATLYGFS